MINASMYMSENEIWETPPKLFDLLDEEFNFDLDVCALPGTAKCSRYFSPSDDGLTKMWSGICWMNPPYGRKIRDWVKKGHESAINNGATVVALVPARIDTRWWWSFCAPSEVRFLPGRLKFFMNGQPARNSAPFPSAIVVMQAGRPASTTYWSPNY